MSLLTRLKAGDTFDSLEREREQGGKSIELTRGRLPYIVEGFERVLSEINLNKLSGIEDIYDATANITPKNCSAIDIEQFSKFLHTFEDRDDGHGDFAFHHFGSYLNALINLSKDPRVRIHTARLRKYVDEIGLKNDGKTIIIKGNAGGFLGYGMRRGHILVEGNAIDSVCSRMQGGSVFVRGNVIGGDYHDSATGYMSEGGILRVKGEISGRLNDSFENFEADGKGGLTVYHRGELIMDKGEYKKWQL